MKVTKTARLERDELRALVETRYPFLKGQPFRLRVRECRYQLSEPPDHVEVSWDENEVEPWPEKAGA